MSDENYGTCPRCFKRAVKKYVADTQHLADAYGDVSREEYEKLQAKLGKPPHMGSMPESLRETYECYVDEDGELTIYYGCTCENCGFVYDFNHQEKLEFDE